MGQVGDDSDARVFSLQDPEIGESREGFGAQGIPADGETFQVGGQAAEIADSISGHIEFVEAVQVDHIVQLGQMILGKIHNGQNGQVFQVEQCRDAIARKANGRRIRGEKSQVEGFQVVAR